MLLIFQLRATQIMTRRYRSFALVAPSAFNPFALLMDPAAVMCAVESSPGLSSLRARVFRPLDRGGRTSAADADVAAFDAEIEVESADDLDRGFTDGPWPGP